MEIIRDFVNGISSFCRWLTRSGRDAQRLYDRGWFWVVATIIIIFFLLMLFAGLRG